MRRLPGLLAVCLLAVPATALRAQDPGEIVEGALAVRADGYLTRLEALGFAGAVLVVDDGETILRKGYGLADRETGTPITTASVFSLGSITKQFTAAAILALEARGALSVEDSIGEYLTEINVTSPTGIQEIERFDGTNVAGLIWDAIEQRKNKDGR